MSKKMKTQTIRFQVLLTPADVELLQNWQTENDVKSRGQAIRTLIELGVSAKSAADEESKRQSQIGQLKSLVEEISQTSWNNNPKNPSIESIARAWASIDGRLERFDKCKANISLEDTDGTYGGYITDAEELMRRAYAYENKDN